MFGKGKKSEVMPVLGGPEADLDIVAERKAHGELERGIRQMYQMLKEVSAQTPRAKGVSFANATLENINFHGAELHNPDFSGATLKNVNFHGADLINPDFTDSNVREGDLYQAHVVNPKG